MLDGFKKLREAGIVGINSRNLEYILEYNQRENYPRADNKIQTKEIAKAEGIAVPDLYGIISVMGEIKHLPKLIEGHKDFVVKPAHGSGGEGIVVVTEVEQEQVTTIARETLSYKELGHHIANILHGMFSLGSRPDQAMLEYRVKFDPVFKSISYKGVPDIRIVALKGVPVMAMLRLPTSESGGKANLHQGAIGVGVEISSGRTRAGVHHNRVVDLHPDTQKSIIGKEIPQWQKLLEISSQSYELTGLGYQGVDIVLDRDRGPLLLELNTRPGLNLQIANRAGLRPRLEKALKASEKYSSTKDRVRFARDNF